MTALTLDAPTDPNDGASQPPGPPAARAFGPALAACVVAALFCWSFLAAFSDPAPSGLNVTVVGPPALVAQLDAGLEAAAPGAFDLTEGADAAGARAAVVDGDTNGAVIVGSSGATILTASAGGLPTANAVESALGAALGAAGLASTTEDVVPLPPTDSQGTSSFFFILSVTVPAVVFAIASALANPGARSRVRLAALAAFSIGVGVVNSTIAHLIAFDDHWLVTAAIGAGTAFAIGGATIVLQRMVGALPGSALALLFFVLFGLPSTGGPVGSSFLPEVFRSVTDWLPSSAGLDAMRATLYFGGSGVGAEVMVLAVWAIAILALSALLPRVGSRRSPAPGAGGAR